MVSEFKKFQGAVLQLFGTLVIACIENRLKKNLTLRNRTGLKNIKVDTFT